MSLENNPSAQDRLGILRGFNVHKEQRFRDIFTICYVCLVFFGRHYYAFDNEFLQSGDNNSNFTPDKEVSIRPNTTWIERSSVVQLYYAFIDPRSNIALCVAN
jgi:hypothetical protein